MKKNIIYSKSDIDNVVKRYSMTHKLYIVGAGAYGKQVGNYFNCNNVRWMGYIDKQLSGETICEKPVFSYSKVFEDSSIFIIAGTTVVSEYIEKEFEIKGIDDNKLFFINSFDSDFLYQISVDQDFIRHCEAKVREQKNFHKGKRCFIIGNGPSLHIEDLNKITGDISFACNEIYALFPYTKWRPTYYAVSDSVGFKNMEKNGLNIKMVECVQAYYAPLVLRNHITLSSLEYLDKFYFLKTTRGIYYCNNNVHALFSSLCDNKVYTIGTVLYILCQMAVYLGFKNIYFLGVDMSFSVEKSSNGTITTKDVKNHHPLIEQELIDQKVCNEDYSGYDYIGYIDNQMAGFRAMKEYANNNNVNIYNATKGGNLEVFERVNFESLF